MNSNQSKKRRKRGSAKLSRWKNGKKHKRRAVLPVLESVAVAEQVPTDDAGDPISVRVAISTKRTKAEIKQANKELYDGKRYLSKKLDKMDDVVSNLQGQVKDLKESVGMHALLEAAAQAKASDLKASAEKAAKLLGD